MTPLGQLQRVAHRLKVFDNGLCDGTRPRSAVKPLASELSGQVGRERGGAVEALLGREAGFRGASGDGPGRAFRRHHDSINPRPDVRLLGTKRWRQITRRSTIRSG